MPAPRPAAGIFTGAWTRKAYLNSYHYDATGTVLKDRRILLVGGVLGDGSGGPYATAEVYDPVTGKWTQTGQTVLEGGPYWHTATRLSDGKVLVAGGYITDSAEIYDPATNSWTATGNMLISRYRHSAVLLPSGKVLVAGGFDGGSSPTNSAELYDPATGTWAATGDMNSTHAFAPDIAVLLQTGNVLMEGGYGPEAFTAELYNPATGIWTNTGSLHVGRWFHRATLLPDGKVLVSAGVGQATTAQYAELYDPEAGIWCLTGSMHVGRYLGTATLLPGGEVLVAGGLPFDGAGRNVTKKAEIWDPVTGAWKLVARMNLARAAHIAAPLPNGALLVAGGGIGPFYNAATTSEIFHPRPPSSKSQPAETKSPRVIDQLLRIIRFHGSR